jgi:tetratricopeptide (TPR) repeat protein
MDEQHEFIRGTALLVVFGIVVIAAMVYWLRHSKDEPGLLVVKWITTGLLLAFCYVSVPLLGLFAPWCIALAGLLLAILWTPNIVNTLFRPVWHAIDGADEEPNPQPMYSVARAKRKRGHYTEALADVRAQLARFPKDVEGHLLVAEILAEDMSDLPGAEIAIHRFVEQPGHAPRNIAFALNTLADWHLKYAQDRDGARRALERVQELCPNTELAVVAAQRIAHLADTAHLLRAHDRPKVPLHPGVVNVGLLHDSSHLQPEEADPAKLAADYVAHLEQHPFDTEAREKLAVLYADHFKRLDLAADQLNQLIEQPNLPLKQITHWLNLLADLYVRHGADYDAAWLTLGRIIEKFPDHPVAELARNRMDLLKLEIKGQEKSQAVRLGSYEQNIGLKSRLPREL